MDPLNYQVEDVNAPEDQPDVVLPLLSVDLSERRFELGDIVATKAAMRDIDKESMEVGLARHARCDWGEVNQTGRHSNELALKQQRAIWSSYHATNGLRFWVVTEGDRTTTTVMAMEDL